MTLDKRLSLIASYVRPGSRLADVGTDHARLPAALVATGHCPRAIASDLRTGPVNAARLTVNAAGLEKRIDIRQGDGLAPLSAKEADDIVIAGMGSETIAGILDAAPWTRNSHFRFILQPMTRVEYLHRYLLQLVFPFCVRKRRRRPDACMWYCWRNLPPRRPRQRTIRKSGSAPSPLTDWINSICRSSSSPC